MPSLFSFLSKPETESLPSKLPKYHSNPELVPCSRLSLIYLAWLSTEMSRAHKLLIFFSLIITNVFCISIINTTHKKKCSITPYLSCVHFEVCFCLSAGVQGSFLYIVDYFYSVRLLWKRVSWNFTEWT